MKKYIVAIVVVLVVAGAGCARSPEHISSSYVSPALYQSFTCKQLGVEQARLRGHMEAKIAAINEKISDDAGMAALGIIISPLFFFAVGDGPEAAEYAHLKGENSAINQALASKDGCEFKPYIIPKPEPLPEPDMGVDRENDFSPLSHEF